MLKIDVTRLNDITQALTLSKKVASVHVKAIVCCLEKMDCPAGQKKMITEAICKNGKR